MDRGFDRVDTDVRELRLTGQLVVIVGFLVTNL
jgi:hypothetical protein